MSKDYAQARAWYQKAAAKENRSAAYNLGNHYRYGLGVVQDYQQARQWYEKAAAQDNADAKKALQTW